MESMFRHGILSGSLSAESTNRDTNKLPKVLNDHHVAIGSIYREAVARRSISRSATRQIHQHGFTGASPDVAARSVLQNRFWLGSP